MIFEQLERRRLFAVTVSQDYAGYYRITGDESNNSIVVTVGQSDGTFEFEDVFYGGVEHIGIYGLGGNDRILVFSPEGSGSISASIYGGDGDDFLSLNFDGAIWGGAGNDTINISDAFRGEVYGEDGDDVLTIDGDCVDAEIHGGDGNDFIDASANNYGVLIHGDAGDDTIYGSAHDDVILGDDGTDSVFAQGGNDTIYTTEYAHGGDGYDILYMTLSNQSHDGIEKVLYA